MINYILRTIPAFLTGLLFIFMMLFNVTHTEDKTKVSLTGSKLQAEPSCFECSVPRTEACVIVNGHTVEGVKKEVDCPNDPAVPEKN